MMSVVKLTFSNMSGIAGIINGGITGQTSIYQWFDSMEFLTKVSRGQQKSEWAISRDPT